MPGEKSLTPLPEGITLGAGASDEVKATLAYLDVLRRREKLITTISVSTSFTLAYIILTTIPSVTSSDITGFFILSTVLITLTEILRYYKIF